jgi:hypothetical protein
VHARVTIGEDCALPGSRHAFSFDSLRLHRSSVVGNWTDPRRYRCHGCQDGYLTEYLARTLRWTYTRLAIDGLKSIIFHGPSPTLCIAAGTPSRCVCTGACVVLVWPLDRLICYVDCKLTMSCGHRRKRVVRLPEPEQGGLHRPEHRAHVELPQPQVLRLDPP